MKRSGSGGAPGEDTPTASTLSKPVRPTWPGPASSNAQTVRLPPAPPKQKPKAPSPSSDLDPEVFRGRLISWYRRHARVLPWRGTTDPYCIWVSEVMLQQTRVAAVIDHYNEFLRRFPTLLSLALAPESEVLAAWSGLGYYRRARMLHKAAHFIAIERAAVLPSTSVQLRTLPGIGDYTAAAIASIAFGESIAVVDGNVERVLLRLTGRPAEATAAARAFVHAQARALVPPTSLPRPNPEPGSQAAHPIASAMPNDPGDHNQAMMELGATICLPRAPLCLECPVYDLCRTRGEHPIPPRPPQRSLPIAFLLDIRKRGPTTEVLLERRPSDASLMPDMFELPPLPLDIVEGREPVLRVRHSITNTNYYVQIFTPRPSDQPARPGRMPRTDAPILRRAIPAASGDLQWTRASRLTSLPLTGLTRKVLQRLHIMDRPRLAILE